MRIVILAGSGGRWEVVIKQWMCDNVVTLRVWYASVKCSDDSTFGMVHMVNLSTKSYFEILWNCSHAMATGLMTVCCEYNLNHIPCCECVCSARGSVYEDKFRMCPTHDSLIRRGKTAFLDDCRVRFNTWRNIFEEYQFCYWADLKQYFRLTDKCESNDICR